MSKFHQIFGTLPVTVARSSSDSNAVRYVLPVLWMTSYFHIMERIGQNKRRRVYVYFSSPGGGTGGGGEVYCLRLHFVYVVLSSGKATKSTDSSMNRGSNLQRAPCSNKKNVRPTNFMKRCEQWDCNLQHRMCFFLRAALVTGLATNATVLI